MAVPVITGGNINGLANTSYNLTADQPVTWSINPITTTGGSLTNVTATSCTFVPPNKTGAYYVEAKNASNQIGQAGFDLTSYFAYTPDYSFDAEVDKRVLVFTAEDGSRQTRTKRGMKMQQTLAFTKRTLNEYLAVEQFWNDHYPGVRFYYTDPVAQRTYLCYFTTKLTHRPSSFNNYEYGFTWLEL